MPAQVLRHGAAGSPAIAPRLLRNADLGVAWSDAMQTAAQSQQHSLRELVTVIVIAAASAAAIAVVALVMLSWSRASARRGEIAIRRAVGASRRALTGAALVEGATLAVAAAAFGIAGGLGLARTLLAAWPGQVDPWRANIPLVVAPVCTLLVLGALLSIRHARTTSMANPRPNTLGIVPLILQMAGSMAVLMTATLAARQATLLLERHGEVRDALRYEVDATDVDAAERASRYAVLLRDLDADPAVRAASLSSPGTASGLGTVDWAETDCGQCVSGNIILKWHGVQVAHHAVSPDTFRVLGLPVTAGRTFTAEDGWNAPRVAIVNRQLALRHFERGNPIGRVIYIGSYLNRVPYTVVGVVDDQQPPVLGSGAQPRFAVYLSVFQHPAATLDLAVQPAAPGVAPTSTSERSTRLAGLSLTPVATQAQVDRQESSVLEWMGRVVRLEGLAALLTAVLGVLVGMRTWGTSVLPELALRRAMGARRRHIAGWLLVRVAALVILAFVAARLFLVPSLSLLLAGVVRDPVPLPATVAWSVALLLFAAALAGIAGPGYAALRRAPARWLG